VTTPAAELAGHALHQALVLVAARAVLLRSVVDAEWDGRVEEAVGIACAKLREALDKLELVEPAIHAELAAKMDPSVLKLRAELEAGG
jgi:hypothetical protein